VIYNGTPWKKWLCVAGLLIATQSVWAQSSILNTNLIVNGNAEAGPASPDGTTTVSSIPGWTRTGNADVLPYDLTGLVLLSDPAPPDHGFNYFAGAIDNQTTTLTQLIDVSSAASAINAASVKYTASVYLGGIALPAKMTVTFENASGQPIGGPTLGPAGYDGYGMSLQQQIGLVPSNTTQIVVTLTLANVHAVADSLSLVLGMIGTSPGSVLGTNLVVNPGAESGPSAPPHTSTALYVPGWSTSYETSVAPYGGTGWIAVSDPGPADRGVNLFCGGVPGSTMYQDIDVSPAATLIDSTPGVAYEISAWLGAEVGAESPTLTYTFFDWNGTQLAPTSQFSVTPPRRGLFETFDAGTLPSGTRRVHIALSFPNYFNVADDIAFTLSAPSGPPVIDPGGIVSAGDFGGFKSIAPGSWIEIYGTNLTSSSSALGWSGSDFTDGVAPTKLGDVTVSVGGTAAFIDYISGGQIDAQVPSDAPISSGWVEITVSNSNGTSAGFPIYVKQTQAGLLAPGSFVVNKKQYVAAILSDGSFALPANAIAGVASRPAMPGETVTIYGVGFGPVTPDFPAGTIVTSDNSLTMPLQLLFGSTAATLSYYGLAPTFVGLYQFDVVVPNVNANNAESISFNLGGASGTQTLYIAVGN
jgi:uncharacterized protein (TIGR03437 family)